MSLRKPNIAIFFGGNHGSRDLSIETAYWVCQYLPRSQYQIIPIHILANGNWQVPLGSLPKQGPVKKMLTSMFEAVPILSPTAGLDRLFNRRIDAMMTFVRGHGGDDGSLHGFGQSLSIPVVGPSLPVYQKTNDKYVNALLVSNIMTSPETLRFRKDESTSDIVTKVRNFFVPPLFVKPVYEEASIGVEQVDSIDELSAAINRTKATGDVLVQKKAIGNEFSLTLFRNKLGRIQTLPITHIKPQKSQFYDHLAKRQPNRVTINPVMNKDSAYSLLLKQAEAIYDDLGCDGVISFDISSSGKKNEFLEMNSVLSLTNTTPLAYQLRAGGLSPSILLDQQIKKCLV